MGYAQVGYPRPAWARTGAMWLAWKAQCWVGDRTDTGHASVGRGILTDAVNSGCGLLHQYLSLSSPSTQCYSICSSINLFRAPFAMPVKKDHYAEISAPVAAARGCMG